MITDRKNVAIVGQGVMGLTCAHRLLKRGFSVKIFSKEEFTETTSLSAGAYWWPHKAYPEERVAKWAKTTYDEYARLQTLPESGIHFERHFRFCLDPDDSAYARTLVDEWEEVNGADYGVPCHEAFLVTLPVIDVPVFMPYLRDEVVRNGAQIQVQEIDNPTDLFPEFDLVVNCTGVWARHFAKDPEVFPIRGQVVRVSLPKDLRESTRLYQKEDEFTLILPRKNDVVLGGTAQEGDWSREPSESDTQAILERCRKLVPQLAQSEQLGVAVGLRPGRPEVRLELELPSTDQPVIHNYGHGGGGYTVAWGCADEVAQLACEHFSH
tara:strand:- start:3069 stop:4040 length:972 start_codon:yes stop_codon:yes gene_type:complete